MAQQLYDRTAEDLGNLVGLEQVNLRINNQGLAHEFYRSGLGLTRDPYMFPGTNNMWVNVGKGQFHLPTSDPNVLRGHLGLGVPSLQELCERLGDGGRKLTLLHRATAIARPEFDGQRLQIYLHGTSGPHDGLVIGGLITEKSRPYQYLGRAIACLDRGQLLITNEHEGRVCTPPR